MLGAAVMSVRQENLVGSNPCNDHDELVDDAGVLFWCEVVEAPVRRSQEGDFPTFDPEDSLGGPDLLHSEAGQFRGAYHRVPGTSLLARGEADQMDGIRPEPFPANEYPAAKSPVIGMRRDN